MLGALASLHMGLSSSNPVLSKSYLSLLVQLTSGTLETYKGKDVVIKQNRSAASPNMGPGMKSKDERLLIISLVAVGR